MKSISEMTLIPIGLAVVIIGGGTTWLTVMASTLTQNSKDIASIKDNQSQYMKDLYKIELHLAKIRWKLGIPNE